MTALPKTGTKTRSLLEFVGRHDGVRFTDMQKFLCELSDRDWEARESVPVYKRSSNVPGAWVANGTKTVRVHRGWWSTNLSGPDGICKRYLAKKDGRWYLNERTAGLMRGLANLSGQGYTIYSVGMSSLEKIHGDDTIKGSSDTCTIPPQSKVLNAYVEHAKMTTAASFDPTTGVRLEFVPKVELPLGPTIPEGSFKIHQPQEVSDVDLIAQLRRAEKLVAEYRKHLEKAQRELDGALQLQRQVQQLARERFGL